MNREFHLPEEELEDKLFLIQTAEERLGAVVAALAAGRQTVAVKDEDGILSQVPVREAAEEAQAYLSEVLDWGDTLFEILDAEEPENPMVKIAIEQSNGHVKGELPAAPAALPAVSETTEHA